MFYDASAPWLMNAPPELQPWREGALIKHDKFLFSYGNRECSAIPRLREYLSIPNNVYIMCDSGGYQVATKNLMIDPISAYEWQVNNGNSIVSMDIPPKSRLIHAKGEYPMDEFKRSIKRTRKALELLKSYYENRPDGIELLLVLHGGSLRQFEMWWEECIAPFLEIADGVFVAGRNPSSVFATLDPVLFIYSKGVRRIHMGGVSKRSTTIPALIYSENKLNLKISVDVSTAVYDVVFGHYKALIPGYGNLIVGYNAMRGVGLTSRRVFERTMINANDLPCICPVCEYVRRNGYITSMIKYPTRRPYSWFIALHNLWVIKYWIKFCEVMIKIEGEKFKYLDRRIPAYIENFLSGRPKIDIIRWF